MRDIENFPDFSWGGYRKFLLEHEKNPAKDKLRRSYGFRGWVLRKYMKEDDHIDKYSVERWYHIEGEKPFLQSYFYPYELGFAHNRKKKKTMKIKHLGRG